MSKAVSKAYATALLLYDVTGGLRIGKRHRRVTKAEVAEHMPTLKSGLIASGFLYYDARADDARLTLAVARTAAIMHGATVANYAEVVGFEHSDDGKTTSAIVDCRNFDQSEPVTVNAPQGPTSDAGELTTPNTATSRILVRAKIFVNATGVWADAVNDLGNPSRMPSIRPAKGIHLTFPRAKLPCDIAAVVPVRSDHRAVFVVPWPDGDDVYVGTTDTPWDGSLDDPACLPSDVDYILSALNDVVDEKLSAADVKGIWSGLRPLLAPEGRKVSERTADLSRRHSVSTSSDGMITVTGGKLTTYRKMAEDATNTAVAQLRSKSNPPIAVPPWFSRLPLISNLPHGAGKFGCRTKSLRLIGYRDPAAVPTGELSSVEAHLQSRYGSESSKVMSLAKGKPELLEPLVEGLPYLKVEAVRAIRDEMAMTVEDVFARRTRASIRDVSACIHAVEASCELLASHWGRSVESVENEAADFIATISGDLDRAGIPLERSAIEEPASKSPGGS